MPQEVVRYSEQEKFKAVATYIGLGNLSATATELGFPYETLRTWKKQEWWKEYERAIKNEENAALSAKYRKIVKRVQEQLIDRLENGDEIVLKNGERIRVKVRAKDLALIGTVSTDKIIKLDESTEDKRDDLGVEARLKMLAKELVDLAKGTKKPINIIDVSPEGEINGLQQKDQENEEINHAI